MGLFGDLKVILDVVIILVPLLIGLYLVFKFVVPRHPKMGIGLAVGGGLLGAFLIGRKVKKAFAVEDKLTEFNEDMAEFKTVQKRRQEAVMANKQVINALEEKRKKLAAKGDQFKTELDLIDAELSDRQKWNDKLIKNAAQFVTKTKDRSKDRQALLEKFNARHNIGSGVVSPVPERESTGSAVIQLNGYQLLEV